MFTGRVEELVRLSDFARKATDGSRLLVLKGRSGIGKTTLLKEFLKDRPHIFFTAYPTTGAEELSILSAEAGFEEPAATLEQLLEFVTVTAGNDEFTVVFDQYPAFAKADPTFEETLYDYVSDIWAGTNISVIFVSDSFLAIDKLIHDGKGMKRWTKQLYGEFTLPPLGFYEARELMQNRSANEQMLLFGLSGGIPAALLALSEVRDDGKGLSHVAVKHLFLSGKSGVLTPEENLGIDLREKSYYNRMLKTLASGKSRVNEISAEVEKPKDVVVPYMNTLIELSVVTKENPVTEPDNRRKTRYSIVNTFDLFWYRYIVPHMAMIFAGQEDVLIEEQILPRLSSFMKEVFIRICREYVSLGGTGLPVDIGAVGNWWENDDEKKTTEDFDLVAAGSSPGEKSTMIFARCYYGAKNPVDMLKLKGLIDLTKKVREKGEMDYYIAFSDSGFHDTAVTAAGAIKNIILISTEDLVNA